LLTVERRVGRLVEARFAGNPTEADVAAWGRAADTCLKICVARTQKIAVCCTDLRPSALFRPAVSDELIAVMRKDNKLVERNALVGIGGATFTMQLQRLLREAAPVGAVRRRVFIDPEEAFAWLDELLDAPERERVREFMREYEPSTADQGRASFDHALLAPQTGAENPARLSKRISSTPPPRFRAPAPSRPDRSAEPERRPSERPPEPPGRSPKGGRF